MSPKQAEAYNRLLSGYQHDYVFVATGFTEYELLCSSSKSHQEVARRYISRAMVYASLSQPLMVFAARVFNLYKVHPSTKHMQISTGDIVNAAFAIAQETPLMTMDNNDYPRPFFKEVARERVHYQSSKNREIMDMIYVLEPDIAAIEYALEEKGL